MLKPDFKFYVSSQPKKGDTMFVCDKCGKTRQDSEACLRQVGGAGIICMSCLIDQGQTPTTNAVMQAFREKDFERRERIALAVLTANLCNQAINNATLGLTVPQMIRASFRVADEFILFSTESFKLELKRSGQIESTD